jgi:molybdenum cofactor guanylyltransferase
MNLTAIILAGGQSKRMGTDKALMPYLGKPLIQYSIDLAFNFTKNIIISANKDNFKDLGFNVVRDKYPLQAPLAGIHSGLTFSNTDWNLILTCDMPNVTVQLIDWLISNLEGKTELLLPGHHGYIEPLCGFYNKSLIPLIESNIRKNRLSPIELLEVAPHKIVQMDDLLNESTSFIFKNVNSRNDLIIFNP